MKIIKYIKWIFHFTKLLINPAGHIKSLIFLGDELTKSKPATIGAQKLLHRPKLREMYANRDGMKPISLSVLSSYSHGTLGYHVYRFYHIQNLDVYPVDRFDHLTESQYIVERTRKLHDILHVVLGYGTDLIGEAKLNAYVLNQSRMPIPFLIVVGIGIKYLFRHPLQFHTLISELEEGWKMGDRTFCFLEQDWDCLLQLSLDEVCNNFVKDIQLQEESDVYASTLYTSNC